VLLAVVAAIGLLVCAFAAGCGGAKGESDGELALSGGAGTVFDTTPNAFALALADLHNRDRRAFAIGNALFNRNWVTAPASTSGTDGLGPTFNAQSCSSCHFKDGRGRPPANDTDPERGLLLRLSIADADGHPQPVQLYGSQLQDRAINGVPAEGRIHIGYTTRRGHYGDGTPYALSVPHYDIVERAFGPLPKGVQISPRVASGVFGVGLLEAIPEQTIIARADPTDHDRDGISGRPNRVADARSGEMALGRFGWKANVPTVEQQNASAFNGDIGVSSPIFTKQNCPAGQRACRAARTGGRPEVDAHKLDRVTRYTRTLAVPARRDVGAQRTSAGAQRFADFGCAACHVPEVKTGAADIAALRDQVIRPYTDLLLHDMGPGLADGRPDGTGDRRGVAHRAAVGNRARADREPPHPLPARRPRTQPRRSDPLARRRGIRTDAAISRRTRTGAPRAAGIPRVAVGRAHA
jgi:CxxC motif-containing protein (DUF1111 family)